MDVKPYRTHAAWFRAGLLALAPLLLVCSANRAAAQVPQVLSTTITKSTVEPALGESADTPSTTSPNTIVDGNVKQVYCPSCGAGLLSSGSVGTGGGGCPSCGYAADCPEPGGCGCGGPCCHPGGHCCIPCTSDSWCGQCWCRFYNCICCPDPCYDYVYSPVSDAGFFIDSARPLTRFHMAYDGLQGVQFPDRAEYYWARTGGGGKGPKAAESATNINQLLLITEVGAGRAGIVTTVPYLHTEPNNNGGDGGWGDISIAVKSLLLDCELMEFTFQMKTYIPSGKFTTGLGTGHTSLEPAFLCTAKLTPRCYLQSEMAEWIPIGGDSLYEGSILHYALSLNHLLWQPGPGLSIVGTLETSGWFFQSGRFSDPAIVGADGKVIPQQVEDTSFYSFGCGIRFVMCDKMDIGFGAAWGVNHPVMFDQQYKVEFRYRF